MKANHLIPLEADALTTWLRLLKESLIVVIVNRVNPIPVVKPVSKLPSVNRGPSPTVIFIVSEISLIDDAALRGILHAKAVLSGSAHLPLVNHAIIEQNDAVPVDRISRDALRFHEVLTDANFLHRLHQLRRERDRLALVFCDGALLSPRGVHTDKIVQHQKQCKIIITPANNSWILPYPRKRQSWSSTYAPDMLETILLQQFDYMGSLSSAFKGDKQWTEPQINTKVDQVFTKYDLTGHGLDRVDFGRWLQSEAQDIGKTYNEKQMDDAYNEVHHDQNGRIQRQQLAEYLRKVHNVT